jgi:cobalt-zinc-cadmium efflux system outer membrane protein
MTARLWLAVAMPELVTGQTGLTLREALDRALSSHPALAVFDQRIGSSIGARQQAGLSPNPKLVLQTENTRPYGDRTGFVFWRDTDDFAYLQNTFEASGKRQRRIELADADVRKAEFERELTRRQIAVRVAQSYWQAAGAQRQHDLLVEAGRTLAQIVEYHEVRVREGAMAEADLIRVRLEAQRLAISANRALLDAERGRIQLLREMGQTEFPPVRFTDPVEGAAEHEPSGDSQTALERRVEIRLARTGVERARANLGLQQSIGRPNLDVLFGYKHTGGLDTLLGGIQVDLPFRNRNQGLIAQASAEIRVAESSLAATQALVRAEIETARMDYDLRRREVTTLLEPLVSQAAETYRIAEAAYRAGGSDLLRLLDAQRVRIEAQIALARGRAELHQSWVALQMALGDMP